MNRVVDPEIAARALSDFISAELRTSRWYVHRGANLKLAPGHTAILPETFDALKAEHQGRIVPFDPERAELRRQFSDLLSWKAWLQINPWAVTFDYEKALTDEIERVGFEDPFLGRAQPGDFSVERSNIRESITFRGMNSRIRAILMLIAAENLSRDAKVYAPESVTPLSRALAERFPAFIGSEYLPTQAERARFPDTRHEDVQALSFDDHSLDLYVSCEVMEHIPFVGAAVSEAARVLVPGGLFIATFPFLAMTEHSVTKAALEPDGNVRVVGEPEYHGNPVDPKGSLVFSIPAWDILDLARSAGFAKAEMVAVASLTYGIMGSQIPIFVMRAVR